MAVRRWATRDDGSRPRAVGPRGDQSISSSTRSVQDATKRSPADIWQYNELRPRRQHPCTGRQAPHLARWGRLGIYDQQQRSTPTTARPSLCSPTSTRVPPALRIKLRNGSQTLIFAPAAREADGARERCTARSTMGLRREQSIAHCSRPQPEPISRRRSCRTSPQASHPLGPRPHLPRSGMRSEAGCTFARTESAQATYP